MNPIFLMHLTNKPKFGVLLNSRSWYLEAQTSARAHIETKHLQ